jgi:hypothetical protein
MLFLATSRCSEVSQCGVFSIRWRTGGFGIGIAEAWVRGPDGLHTKIGEFAGEDSMQKARAACTTFKAGWLP